MVISYRKWFFRNKKCHYRVAKELKALQKFHWNRGLVSEITELLSGSPGLRTLRPPLSYMQEETILGLSRPDYKSY